MTITRSHANAAPDIEALHAACDRLVATAADPTAARSVLLRMWALGAAAADDLLDDLCRAAQRHAARTGTEASPVELLDALGHPQHAATLKRASARGLVEHDEAIAHARAQRAVNAARAIARLVQVDHHRRSAASGRPAPSAPPEVSAPARCSRYTLEHPRHDTAAARSVSTRHRPATSIDSQVHGLGVRRPPRDPQVCQALMA